MTSIAGLNLGNMLGVTKTSATPGLATGDQQSIFEKILADFKKAASETPAEKAADGVLKKHGLTKDQLGALPKDQQDAIQREIAEAVKRTMKIDSKGGTDSTGFSGMA